MDAAELQAWRAARNLTQQELAELLGVHRMTVVKWERGQRGVKRPLGKILERALHDIDNEIAGKIARESLVTEPATAITEARAGAKEMAARLPELAAQREAALRAAQERIDAHATPAPGREGEG